MRVMRRKKKEEQPLSYNESQVRLAIEGVLREHAGKPVSEIKQLLKEAYPFGERKGPHYKVWNKLTSRVLKAYAQTNIE